MSIDSRRVYPAMTSMSAKRHLRELQWRLMIVAAFFMIGAAFAYTYQAQLVPLLMAPLHGERLIYLNPAGGFTFVFLVSIYAGIAAAFPIFLQQVYGFLRPALPQSAQKNSAKLIIGSFLLLACGLLFGYFVAVPNALTFLYAFADQYVDASLTAESYLNFMISYTIGIGIVFQIPLLLMLIHAIKPLTPGGLMKSERWVIVIAFIIAAVITPTPDPINQTLIAAPVIVVYQIGVFAILWSTWRAKVHAKRLLRRSSKKRTTHAIPHQTPVQTGLRAAAQVQSTGYNTARPSLQQHLERTAAPATPHHTAPQAVSAPIRRPSMSEIVNHPKSAHSPVHTHQSQQSQQAQQAQKTPQAQQAQHYAHSITTVRPPTRSTTPEPQRRAPASLQQRRTFGSDHIRTARPVIGY